MKLSVVIPAYNEEKCLPETLRSINDALKRIGDNDVIVVDNGSTDATSRIAEDLGARVIAETEHNIAKVRNAGVFYREAESSDAATRGSDEVIVFIDADTVVKPGLFENILGAMSDQRCLGGSSAVEYERPYKRFWMSAFMKLWEVLGRWSKMRGGACLFCRRDIFEELGGFDTTIYVGEDIDFHWRLDKLAKSRGGHTVLVEPAVITSSRRWNRMGLIPMLFYTHPITVLSAWRVRSFWKDWYDRPIR